MALVLLCYGVAGVAVLALGGWLRRVLVLPSLFDTLLRGGLVAGALLAAALAWHYPKLAADPSHVADPSHAADANSDPNPAADPTRAARTGRVDQESPG